MSASVLRRLRLALFALLLVLGQAAMLAHAAAHAGDGDDGEPPHVCLVCVAGYNLDGPVPGAFPPPLPTPAGAVMPAVPVVAVLPRLFLARARARAPPAA